MSDRTACPLCGFSILYGPQREADAHNTMADHLTLCPQQTADDRLAKQLEQEQTR